MFKRIFVKDIDNWKYWLTIAIIIKVLFFIFNYTQKLPESDGNIIYAGLWSSVSFVQVDIS